MSELSTTPENPNGASGASSTPYEDLYRQAQVAAAREQNLALNVSEGQSRDPDLRLQQVIIAAQQAGLDQATLDGALRAINSGQPKTITNMHLKRYASKASLTPAGMLQHIQKYRKAQIRANERGPLNHYHQTTSENFHAAVEAGKLASNDALTAAGAGPGSAGSRPEAVQMTRDQYSREGDLRQRGLVNPNSIGARGGVALVFNESIMDGPNYDALDIYPTMPEIPLDRAAAVLVNTPEEVDETTALLSAKGLTAPVMTREQWEDRAYGQDE